MSRPTIEQQTNALADTLDIPKTDYQARIRIMQLLRAARRYARIQLRWTSEEMDEATTKATEKLEATLELRIQEYAASIPATVKFDGDPRGYTVKLVMPGRENLYDCLAKEGLCVPGS